MGFEIRIRRWMRFRTQIAAFFRSFTICKYFHWKIADALRISLVTPLCVTPASDLVVTPISGHNKSARVFSLSR